MKPTRAARKIIEKALAAFGYSLHIDGEPPRGYVNFLEYVKRTGFYPSTVFDIGVGYGTPWLYEAFPDAHFVLIEPQVKFEESLKKICGNIDAEYHLVGAGAAPDSLPIYSLEHSSTGSSFLPPTENANRIWGDFSKTEYSLPIVPLDSFGDKAAPYLIKIDTEGFEMEVLKGATKILEETGLVLLEVAMADRQEGESDLIELGVFLKEHGFRLTDIPCMTQQSVDGPLLYCDVAFTRF